jgi:hypothetical protein
MLLRFWLIAPFLLLMDAGPAVAGNGYITTCEGIGCYGRSSLCYLRTSPNGSRYTVTCYWPND